MISEDTIRYSNMVISCIYVYKVLYKDKIHLHTKWYLNMVTLYKVIYLLVEDVISSPFSYI